MARVDYTDRELRQGRRLLRDIMPRAKAKVMKSRRENPTHLSMRPISNQGNLLMARLRQEKLHALVIYQRDGGRWYADLVLKKMPAGSPTVMGTPVSDPLASEKDAREAGQKILETALNTCFDNEIARSDKDVKDELLFDFPSGSLNVPTRMVQEISVALSLVPEDARPTLEIMREQLRTRLLEFFGVEDVRPEDWATLSEDRKTIILANVTSIMALGDFRYDSKFIPAPEEPDEPDEADNTTWSDDAFARGPHTGRFDA